MEARNRFKGKFYKAPAMMNEVKNPINLCDN